MTEADIEAENRELLLSRWTQLVVERADPIRIGLNSEAARILGRLDHQQVLRAAQVNVPLFDFACTQETIQQAFAAKRDVGAVTDESAQLFLVNRWRASEASFVTAQMLYNMSRAMHSVIKPATYSMIVAAANSGINLFKLAVRPHYLFHAGSKFDMLTSHRTALAICNAVRSPL